MMQDLEAQQAQKEYDRLVSIPKRPTSTTSALFSHDKRTRSDILEEAASREDWQQAKREISAVCNVLASMAAVATAAWWACGNAMPVKVRSFPAAFRGLTPSTESPDSNDFSLLHRSRRSLLIRPLLPSKTTGNPSSAASRPSAARRKESQAARPQAVRLCIS